MKHIKNLENEGQAPGSITDLAATLASKDWHITANGEACRRLIEHGYLVIDPKHPSSLTKGQGAVVLTPEGKELLDTL